MPDRGYLLPDGDAYTDVLRWFLVAVPDKPEYVRAALGAYTRFTKWWVWERDPEKRGADAADAWDEAVHATLGALEMGFPDILLGHIDEVEGQLAQVIDLLRQADYCCNMAPYDEVVTSEFSESVPGTDTPPGTWGDGEVVADTDDWYQLVCGAAHAYVDHLVAMAEQIDTILTLGVLGIGAVTAILSLLAGAGILIAVSYGLAASATWGLADHVGSALMINAAGDIEAARADIVCAVIEGGLASAVETAVGPTAWTAFFQFVPYESARNVMLEGEHDGEYLPVNRRSDCDCPEPTPDFAWDWGSEDNGQDGWTETGSGATNMQADAWRISGTHISTVASVTVPNVSIARVRLRVFVSSTAGGTQDLSFRVGNQPADPATTFTVTQDGQTYELTQDIDVSGIVGQDKVFRIQDVTDTGFYFGLRDADLTWVD